MSRLLRCWQHLALRAGATRRAGVRSTLALAITAAITAAVTAATGAHAAALTGSLPDDARRPLPAAPTTGADAATLDLASGRIDAVAADGSSISLQGRLVPLHPSQLLVLAPGGQRFNSSRALRPGMRVRFALEPLLRSSTAAGAQPAPTTATTATTSATTTAAATADAARRIVLIYIESAP